MSRRKPRFRHTLWDPDAGILAGVGLMPPSNRTHLLWDGDEHPDRTVEMDEVDDVVLERHDMSARRLFFSDRGLIDDSGRSGQA